MRVEVLTNAAALESLREAWGTLLARSTNDEPTMSPTWLLPWWRVFGGEDGRALRVVALFDRARLVGLAPLVARSQRLAPGLAVRRLEPLGSGEDEADEIGSDYLSPLVERGVEGSVVSALADALADGAVGPWDELVLGPLNGECPVAVLLANELRARGLMVRLDVTGASFHVPLPATWDAYLAALPSSRRAMLRRSMRAFDAWANGEVELTWARTRAELDRAKGDLLALHAVRWAEAGRAGVFASARFRAFHDIVMPELLAEQALELGCLRVRGQPIAAIYNVLWRNKVRFYQSGRAVDLPSDLRPGIVLHARALQRAIEMGCHEYDFLPSLARYKVELSLASRPVVTLRAARTSALEVVRSAAALAVAHACAVRKSRRIPGQGTRY